MYSGIRKSMSPQAVPQIWISIWKTFRRMLSWPGKGILLPRAVWESVRRPYLRGGRLLSVLMGLRLSQDDSAEADFCEAIQGEAAVLCGHLLQNPESYFYRRRESDSSPLQSHQWKAGQCDSRNQNIGQESRTLYASGNGEDGLRWDRRDGTGELPILYGEPDSPIWNGDNRSINRNGKG